MAREDDRPETTIDACCIMTSTLVQSRYQDHAKEQIEMEISKINFISPNSHVLFYLLYKFRLTISKGEYSKLRTYQDTCLIRTSEYMSSDTTFLSGQNPYNTL